MKSSMPNQRPTSLILRAETDGIQPQKWSWTIYCGTSRDVMLRSRPEFISRDKALMVGRGALAAIGRRLGIKDIRVPPT